MTAARASDWPRKTAVILGVVLFVATGFFYLTSGLVVPLPGLAVLWAVWLRGAWAVARLVARWSWWVLAAAPAAALFWVAFLWFGETVFGWRA